MRNNRFSPNTGNDITTACLKSIQPPSPAPQFVIIVDTLLKSEPDLRRARSSNTGHSWYHRSMNMSRIATNEYIGAKRRAYEASKPDKRRLILDDVCEMTGYSRKYANRLLTGSRKFKVRKGRGATYTEQDKALKNATQITGTPPFLVSTND